MDFELYAQVLHDIEKAKEIIGLQQSGLEVYRPISLMGTENSKDLFEKLDISFEKSLMVTGSLDQILEASLYDAIMIDAFDHNPLNEYGAYLKLAAIQKLDFEEFKAFYFSERFPTNLYYKVREGLREKGLLFWDAIFNYASPGCIFDNLFNSYDHGMVPYPSDNNFSIYTKEGYEKIKERLSKVMIDFYTCDLVEIDCNRNFIGSYNFTYLSNIFYYSYSNPEVVANILKQIFIPLMKKDGKMLFHYLYRVFDENPDLFSFTASEERRFIFYLQSLMEFEVLKVVRSGYTNGCHVSYGCYDAGLVLKK